MTLEQLIEELEEMKSIMPKDTVVYGIAPDFLQFEITLVKILEDEIILQ